MCKSNKKIGSKDSTVYELYNMKTRNTGCPPIIANVSIANTVIRMEVDTGASATLITMKTIKLTLPNPANTLTFKKRLIETFSIG